MTRRIEGFEAIEVYVGERGHVVMKQDGTISAEDQVITILPDAVPQLIEMLKEVMEEAKDWVPEESETVTPGRPVPTL